MSTTYSNPKEMLGYIVVKFIDQQLPLLQQIPYDKRAVFAYYYQLRGLDAQLISFRDDMQLTILPEKQDEEDVVIPYRTAMIEINSIIKENWMNVHTKDYEQFSGALYRWSELIASCYPKLGLVPESDTQIDDKRENMIHPDQKEMEEENEPIENIDNTIPNQDFERTTTFKQLDPNNPIRVENNPPIQQPIREQSVQQIASDAERDRQKQLRREAYRLV